MGPVHPVNVAFAAGLNSTWTMAELSALHVHFQFNVILLSIFHCIDFVQMLMSFANSWMSVLQCKFNHSFKLSPGELFQIRKGAVSNKDIQNTPVVPAPTLLMSLYS